MSAIPANAEPIRRPIHVIPAEAPLVAAQYNEAADKLAGLEIMLKMTCDELDVDWQGYAKDNFDLTYEHMQGDLTALKSILEDYAAKIAHMTVTKYETVYLVNGRYILE